MIFQFFLFIVHFALSMVAIVAFDMFVFYPVGEQLCVCVSLWRYIICLPGICGLFPVCIILFLLLYNIQRLWLVCGVSDVVLFLKLSSVDACRPSPNNWHIYWTSHSVLMI